MLILGGSGVRTARATLARLMHGDMSDGIVVEGVPDREKGERLGDDGEREERNVSTPDAAQRFATLDGRADLADYNFTHFRPKHFLLDVKLTLAGRGIQPGELAPDFALPLVGGGTLRLSELRGAPVLLHFGSLT
ncbi:MAG: hypothetical protein M3R06_00325 [Chloroflexota bacterium]|nr:hypothetical protein [Chloroflexota bacterium]